MSLGMKKKDQSLFTDSNKKKMVQIAYPVEKAKNFFFDEEKLVFLSREFDNSTNSLSFSQILKYF